MKRLRTRIAQGLAPEAFVRAAPFVFGPYVPFPVAFRVMGPNIRKVRAIANKVESIMRANPNMRQVNQDWGTRVPKVHFVLDQDRLRLIGLSSNDAAQQLQFLLTGPGGHRRARAGDYRFTFRSGRLMLQPVA
jgi:multidrug efflux pump subunit AcrB